MASEREYHRQCARHLVRCADDLVRRRAKELTTTQEELDRRLSKLQKYNPLQKIRLLHALTSKQLKFSKINEKVNRKKCSPNVLRAIKYGSHTSDKALALLTRIRKNRENPISSTTTFTPKNLAHLKSHLASLEALVDPDLTAASSDEEVNPIGDETQQHHIR